MLAAADALFTDTDVPQSVSMDDIAAAAGVGKGTLFRAFGSRDNLLDALFAERMASLRAAVRIGDPPLGPATPPRERALGILDALLTFKLDNRQLMRAREVSTSGLLQAEHYRWLHGTLRDLIEQVMSAVEGESGVEGGSGARGLSGAESEASASAVDAGYAAHVLLGALRPDLVDELLTSGETPETIRRAQDALARRILG